MGINQVIKEKSYKFQVSSYKLAEPENGWPCGGAVRREPLGILVCYPLMYSCNFPFPRMGHQLVGGKGKSCKIENLCYGKEDWIRPPAEENRGSIISWNTTIIKDRFVEGEMLPLPCFAARPHSYPGTRSRISKKGHGKPHC